MRLKSAAAPFGIWMLIFTIVPLAIVAYFAFTDANGQFTLSNIREIGTYVGPFWDSIKLGAVATAICLVLAYPLAFIIARSTERVQQTMVMIVMIPMWMNFLLRTYAWMSILEDKGFLNQFLGLFGLHFNMINTSGAIVLGMVYNFLPFMILPIYNAVMKIDSHLIEAAYDLGAGKAYVYRKVILPLCVPGIVSGITMVFIPALTTFVISNMLGGGKVNLIGNIIEQEFTVNSNWYLGSGLSLVMMVFIIISMVLLEKFDKTGEGTFI